MTISATWKTNKTYYQEYYRDWIVSISKYRKWAVPLSVLTITSGIVISVSAYFLAAFLLVAGLGVTGFGIGNLIWHVVDKRMWLRSLSSPENTDQSLSLTFTAAGIEHSGPTAQGSITWAGFKNIIEGKNGLFLVAQKGFSIYIPYAAISPEQGTSQIMRMFNANKTSQP